MARAPGPSARLKLTMSYAGFLMVAGVLMLAGAWFAGRSGQLSEFVLRYVPDRAITTAGGLIPGNRSFLLRAFAPTAGVVLAFLLVFGLVGGWLLSGRMLAPLDRITAATRAAAGGSLDHRIRLPGRRDEFRELADAFDAMLARLEADVAEQQRFAANASHELRTPLAITQTLLDVARHDPARREDDVELVERLHAVNTRAIELTEALLLLSRADRRSFAPEPVDLSLVVEEATETLLPVAEKQGVTIETSGEVTATLGSRALLLQLATNLLHNGIVHNCGRGGTVWVSSVRRGSTVELRVENTGAVLRPEAVSTLTEPFQRGSERIRTDHTGVGLGLAIVQSIARAHDGALTLAARPTGGLHVTVQLPGRSLTAGVNCIFCAIVAGTAPAHVVHEDEHCLAFLDLHPATRGHCLVVPRRHADDLWAIDPDEFAAVARATHAVAALVRKRLDPAGVTLFQANRRAGWQDVFHLHVHVVPRYDDDALRRPWTLTDTADGETTDLAEVAAALTGYSSSA